jgi:hypothetical protein
MGWPATGKRAAFASLALRWTANGQIVEPWHVAAIAGPRHRLGLQ